MDKTPQKVVTKDPKRQERGKKSHKTYMKRLKEKILEDNQLSTPSPTGNSTPSTPSPADRPTPSTSSSTGNSTPSTPFHATRSNDTYVYGVGILAVLVIDVCIFFAYNKKARQVIHEQSINQNDVICFRPDSLYNK